MTTTPFETVARRIAARQHGIVSRRQLIQAGSSEDVIDHRLRIGQLERLHRGVYLVGAVAPPHARMTAACLACGPDAVLSHRSAADLWKILPAVWTGPVEVTLKRGVRRHEGIHAYRLGTLLADETRHRFGIPVTTPARTVLDLASILPTHKVERAAAEAIALRLTDLRTLESIAARHAGQPGSARLKAALGNDGGPQRTRSAAEERFLQLIRRGEIRSPQANALVAGLQVDFYWRKERLVVEIDGLTYHRSPWASERDRRRDAVLAARGIRAMRVSWRQIVEEPEAVLVRLAQSLVVTGEEPERA